MWKCLGNTLTPIPPTSDVKYDQDITESIFFMWLDDLFIQKIEDEQLETEAEQQTIREQQDLTLNKVLGSQIDLSKEWVHL